MSFHKKITTVALLLALGLVCLAAKKEKNITAAEQSFMINNYERMARNAGFAPGDLKLYAIGQSHIDAAWRWRLHQTHKKCIKTFSGAIRHMEMYPDFTYSQSAPQYYEWVKEDDPELFAQIKQRVAEGRWELVGGQWVEPDNVMPDGESFVRQRLLGMRFFHEEFGKTPDIAWLLDSFGYQWNLPQILKKSGAKYFWTSKLTWNDTTVFPFHYFWWQAPDGSRVLTYFVPLSHHPIGFPYAEIDKYKDTRYLLPTGAPELVADYGSDYDSLRGAMSGDWLSEIGVFYGKGDGGHGPTNREIQGQRTMQAEGYTRLATAAELYAQLDKYKDRAPVWNDELYLEYHRGTLTTQGWIKRANRKAETDMRTLEVLQSIGSRLGLSYAYERIKTVWKRVLLNQFHDILPGSSIPEVYQDARDDFDMIFSEISSMLGDAKQAIAARVDTSSSEPDLTPLVVFNTLGWERGGLVELPAGPGRTVIDAAGQVVPSQVGTCANMEGQCLSFMASGIPATGHKTYYLRQGARRTAEPQGELKLDSGGGEITLANSLVSVKIDKDSGWLTSAMDRVTGRELLDGPGNQLMAWRDRAKNYPAWNIQTDYLDHPRKMPEADSVEITATGPVFLEATISRKFKDSPIVQIVRLYAGDPRVHLTTEFDFHEADTLVKAGFDTTINAQKVAAETSYAVIERPTTPMTPAQEAMWEQNCHRWFDLSDGEQGLAILNNGKYAYSLSDNGTGLRITLLKAALYPESAVEAYDVEKENLPYFLRTLATRDRQTDQGRHVAWTALLPHQGDWRQAKLWRAGYEFNTPLEAIVTDRHDGDLPAEASFASLDNDDVYIGAVKKAEDDGDLVVRLVEATGKPARVTLSLDNMGVIEQALETDLLEWNEVPLCSYCGGVTVELSPHEIKTIKVRVGR